MPLPTIYNTGTASVATGATTLTIVGAVSNAIYAGDFFMDPAQPLVPPQRIASVTGGGAYELAVGWPGTALVAAPYVVHITPDSVRVQERTREVLEALQSVTNTGIGIDAFGVFADRADHDTAATGFAYLSIDGDGALVTDPVVFIKNSATSADWSDAILVTGPAGEAGLVGAWLGPWTTATVYAVNDMVSQGGSSYICVVAHTSGAFATDLAAAKWEIVAQKGDTGATGSAGSNGSNGTNGVDGKFSGTEVIKTAAYTALAADVGKTIILNKATADTLSFDEAATLGSTWMVMVKNIGAGTWVLDPNGAETIDGSATGSLAQNESVVVSCNGTALRSLFRGSAASGVLSNGQWLEGRNAANSADLNMFRVNAQNFTEWSNPLYYDDTGGFSDRQAKLTVQRNTGGSAPSTVVASIYSLVESKGDNASLKGASAGYFDSRDRSDVTGSDKGVLHGLTVNVGPRVARNNTPYDDAAAVVIGNSGTASGTEGLYIGHNVGGGGNDFLAAIGIDSHSTDAAIYVNGTHNYGLDFARGAGSTLTTAAVRIPNNKNIVGRNAANNADISLIKLNAGNLVSLRDDVVTVSSTQVAIQSSASFAIPLTITSTNADAVAGPLVLLDRNSASPAANDLGGAFYFYFRNLSAASVLGGGVSSTLLDPTAGSEDVRLTFDTVVAGTFATRLGVGAGVYIGAPTNGDMGAGTLNLDNDLYKDGTKVVGARATGWAAATGTATRTTYATGSVTLPQLAERVKALIDDLTTHGLIGA